MLKVKYEIHSSEIYTKLDTNPNTDPNYNYNIIIDAALEIIDRIITQLDKDEIPNHIYLDLPKAFDTIDQNTLVDKLKYYGVHGTYFNLFSRYL